MPIEASTPYVTQKIESSSYPFWWIENITINASNPDSVFAVVTMRPHTVDEYGQPILCPDTVINGTPTNPTKTFRINDILTAPEQSIQDALAAVMSAITEYATQNNLL